VCEAVRAGHVFTPESLKGVGSDGLASLISKMLALNAADRPDAFSVLNTLRDIRRDITTPTSKPTTGSTTSTPTVVPTGERKPERRGLRGKSVVETKSEPTPEAATASGGSGSTTPGPKRGLRISGELKDKSGGVGTSSTSDESGVPSATAPGVTTAPTSTATVSSIDLTLPSTYRVALSDLIASLRNLETVVGEKIAPPDAPPRVKGSLRHAPRSLSVGERESLSDIALRLVELQKYATDVVSWLKGETLERPPLLESKSDLEVATTPESAPIRVEVESHRDEGSMPPAPYADIDESTPLLPSDSEGPALSVTTDPELVNVASAVTVPTAPEATPPATSGDPSGNHRREERLRNRALDGDKRPPRT